MSSLPVDALVVVADGEGARIFRARGERGAVSLHRYDLIERMNTNDDGQSAAMPDESSSGQIDEATFAKQRAQGLNDSALKRQYEHLVLVADPATLGRVRPLLHKEATQRLLAEFAKGLTNNRLGDIERLIAGSS